jgi:hypothetical protein
LSHRNKKAQNAPRGRRSAACTDRFVQTHLPSTDWTFPAVTQWDTRFGCPKQWREASQITETLNGGNVMLLSDMFLPSQLLLQNHRAGLVEFERIFIVLLQVAHFH